MTHTPGPWEIIRTKDGKVFISSTSARRGICEVTDWKDSPWQEETDANSRLIAAAPDLLKALKTVVRQMEGRHPVGHDAFLAAQRAVIKAEER